MALTNMKLARRESDGMALNAPSEDAPEYPYGLCISLNTETLERLGITQLPTVGDRLELTALVTVQSVGEYERQDEKASRDVGLQITDMELQQPRDDADMAQRLYGATTSN